MMNSRLFWSFGCFLSLLWVTSSAAAGHDDQEIEFTSLELEITDADRLRLDYEIADVDWSRLRHEGIHPELNIYTVSEGSDILQYTFNRDLASRSDSLLLPSEVDAFDLEQVHVEVLGFSGDWRVRRLAAHGVSGARLVFERTRADFTLRAIGLEDARRAPADFGDGVADEPRDDDESRDDDPSQGTDETRRRARDGEHEGDGTHEHHDDRDDKRAKDETGDDASEDEEDGGDEGSETRDEEKLVRDDSSSKARVIETCSSVTDFDDAMNTCVQQAKGFRVAWATDAINGCHEVTDHHSDFEACLEAVRSYDAQNPNPVARACDQAMTQTSDIHACLEAGATYETAPGPMIRACGSVSNFSDEVLGCIESAARLGENGASIIRACEGEEIEACLKRAIEP